MECIPLMSQPTYTGKELTIPVGSTKLRADYYRPQHSRAAILFAQADLTNGQRVVQRMTALKVLQEGYSVVGVNLLTDMERRNSCGLILDAAAQGDRFAKVLDWLSEDKELSNSPLFLFGIGTAGGASLVAGSLRRNKICAITVVNAKGSSRPESYDDILSPTLFLVDNSNPDILTHNRQMEKAIVASAKVFKILHNSPASNGEVARANEVAALASAWFGAYLPGLSERNDGTIASQHTIRLDR